MLMEAFTHSSIFVKLGMLVALVPLGMAILYAIRPSEQRLALMRPLTVGALFAGLSSTAVGFMNILQGIAATGSQIAWDRVALGTGEALVPLFLAFGVLAVTWLLVAVGMRQAG